MNQQILEKAIQKAIDGGWDMFGAKQIHWEGDMPMFTKADKDVEQERETSKGMVATVWSPVSWNDIIFNHDFAKALWGESLVKAQDTRTKKIYDLPLRKWQAHLMDMVVSDDPIKYLGENI